MQSELAAKFEQLTDEQRESVRLVAQHHSRSKDQAQLLGLSPHTIDAWLKRAMRTLGATTREEAGRMYREHQRLVHQAPDLPLSMPPVDVLGPSTDERDDQSINPAQRGRPDPGPVAPDLGRVGDDPSAAGRQHAVAHDGAPSRGGDPAAVAFPAGGSDPAGADCHPHRAPRPVLSGGGRAHDLALKLVAICAVAIAFTLASGAGLAGLVALENLLDRSGPMALQRPPASPFMAR